MTRVRSDMSAIIRFAKLVGARALLRFRYVGRVRPRVSRTKKYVATAAAHGINASHRSVSTITALPPPAAEVIDSHDDGTSRGEYPTDVVTKARPGGAQAVWKQFREIEGERGKDAIDACAHGQEHRQSRLRLEIESESGCERQSRECEVCDEHRAPAHDSRQWDRRERTEQSTEVEQIGSAGFPGLRKEARGRRCQMSRHCMLSCEGPPQERDERIAAPPAQVRRQPRNEAAQCRSAHARSEQMLVGLVVDLLRQRSLSCRNARTRNASRTGASPARKT